MQHTITTSADGSSTLQLTEFGETYHSTNGAFTEAMHIYIKAGVEHLFHKLLPPVCINIFDVGFGTALNCILLYAWQQQLRQAGLSYPKISYYGIEKYPIQSSEAQLLNYPNIIAQQLDLLPDNLAEIFRLMHNCPWEEDVLIPGVHTDFCSGNKSASICSTNGEICLLGNKRDSVCSSNGEICLSGNKSASICSLDGGNRSERLYSGEDFILHKCCADIATLRGEYYREACGKKENRCSTDTATAIIFYDTFSPATQPHLWDEEIFRNIAAGCPAGSVLVTYCSKGTVKQALRGAGFTLERLAGPPGKRHILRGTL